MSSLDLCLIIRFRSVDRLDNALSICIFERNVCILLQEPKVDVSILEVVIVNLDGT